MQVPQESPKNNPWAKVELKEESCGSSFRELMSEDLAKDLQEREKDDLLFQMKPKASGSSLLDLGNVADTSNDFMVALLLQQDFNREHDEQIQREEKHYNKNSKLSVSFRKYKFNPEDYDCSSDDELQHSLDDENRAIDRFEESRRTDPVIPACGYTRHNNIMVTKHDKILSGRKNAERVMNFPPGFNTGDAGGFDMQISNKVYNKLARTAMTESKRKQRVQEKGDKAITEKALDANTRLVIYKMVNNVTLGSMNEIISMGKESIVVHACGGVYGDEELPSECALKIFKTTLTDFKTRERYIREDYRFKDRISKNNNKMMIKLWAEKEFHNLRRLQRAKIPSPKPLLIKKHVLVMSFIGTNHIPAPKLKFMTFPLSQWNVAYEQIVNIMTTMYHTCNLIHGDMSEYNILWHEDKCWVIDVGQSVEPCHPHALKFLYRDCCNIIKFFRSKGISDLPSPLKLFEIVSSINLPDCKEEEAEILIEKYEINQELWREGKQGAPDHFEFLWSEINTPETKALVNKDFEDVDDSIHDLHIKEEKEDIKVKRKNKKRNKKKKQDNALKVLIPEGGPPNLVVVQGKGDFQYSEVPPEEHERGPVLETNLCDQNVVKDCADE